MEEVLRPLAPAEAAAEAGVADRLAGTLLGTALGDALGLPAEGLSARAIARRSGRVERFHLLGKTGFVSDDTEQAALAAQGLCRSPDDVAGFVRAFRRSLLGWFCRLPWGIGLATLRACSRIALGLRRSGVRSAGNGAAMRAAIVGTFFSDRPAERERFSVALAEVTHLDPRAVEGGSRSARPSTPPSTSPAAARRPPRPPSASGRPASSSTPFPSRRSVSPASRANPSDRSPS